ncbi:MAG: glycosyltransferase family 2 protein, partial [Solirubrobacteraceae bacterium]
MSICVPAYNHARFISECVSSALDQDADDFEVLVVDDQSADETFAIVERVADPRLRVVRNERNLGAVGNHNRCLGQARGRFVLILHGDDRIHPGTIRALRMALEEGQAVLAFGRRDIQVLGDLEDRSWADEFGRLDEPLIAAVLKRAPADSEAVKLPGQEVVAYHLDTDLRLNCIGEPSNVMIDREIAQAVGGFRPGLHQVFDTDMWLRLLCHGDAMFVNEAVAVRRVHPSTLTRDNMRSGVRDLDRQWILQGILAEWPTVPRRRELLRWQRRLLLKAARNVLNGRAGPRIESARQLARVAGRSFADSLRASPTRHGERQA